MPLKEQAKKLAQKGFSVFPLMPIDKIPLVRWKEEKTTDPEKIERFWDTHPQANIGIATGNGLLVIDVDVKNVDGSSSLFEWQLDNGFLPDTYTVRTGSGGQHLYYHIGRKYGQKTNIIPGVDIRCDGGLVVAPGSIYKDGSTYTVEKDTAIAEADEIVYSFLGISEQATNKKQRVKKEEVQTIPEGSRNDLMFKYACSLQAKNISDEELEALVLKANDEQCVPPLSKKEIQTIIQQAIRYEKGFMDEDLSAFHKLNKKGFPVGILDAAITADIESKHRFFVKSKVSYIYQDGYYKADVSNSILYGWVEKRIVRSLTTHPTVMRVVNALLSHECNERELIECNQYPETWVCFKNGMLDVKEWKMHPHSPDYYVLNQVPYEMDLEEPVNHGYLDRFLMDCLEDVDDIRMLYEFMGYTFTRDTSQERFLQIRGAGGTGKSTLLSLHQEALGRKNIAAVDIHKLNERFNTIQLLGKLANVCADISSEPLKQVDMIKVLVSGDTVQGEFKGKDPIEFKNTAKLIFSANKLPINLDESTNALFRRLLILVMDKKPPVKDVRFKDKLLQDLPYYIYRCLRAYHEVLVNEREIITSKASEKETKDLYEQSDSVMAFLNEKVSVDPEGREKQMDLYEAYEAYCFSEEVNRQPLTIRSFYSNLEKTKGFKRQKSNGERYFRGLILKK